MSLRFQDILPLAQFTLNDPRRGLRAVLNLGLPLQTGVLALMLIAVLSALISHAQLALMPVAGNPLLDFLMGSPFRSALIQAAGLLLTAGMIHWIGRAWGGTGRLDEAVWAVAWLQVFMLILQLGELVAILLFMPQLALMATLVGLAASCWLISMFVAEVHGFRSPVKVFFGIVASTVAISFVLSFLLVGIMGPEAFTNV
ncbi:Yip1 family protein [Rhodobacter sp.]